MKRCREFEYASTRLPMESPLNSSAVGYFVSSDGIVDTEVVGFEISDGAADLFESDVRAFRKGLAREGKPIPPLSPSAVQHDSLIVLFGPETCAKRAAMALRKTADLIEKRGLFIGRSDQGFEMEGVDSDASMKS